MVCETTSDVTWVADGRPRQFLASDHKIVDTPLDAATAAYFQYSHTLGAFLAGSLSFGSILADDGATPGVE